MGIISSFIDRLPSSKRAMRESIAKSQEVQQELQQLEKRIDALSRQIDSAVSSSEAQWARSASAQQETARSLSEFNANLKNDLDTQFARNQVMHWELYRRDGEELTKAKHRFFRNMSPATGSARIFQLGCAQLLAEFDDLCDKNDIPYWIAFGTLLGAVRHEGFIPWDDDIDLCMMRSDIQRVIDLVKDSEKYRVSIIYDAWNFCKQVRFMYRDQRNPCFLDLFIFEKTSVPTPETFNRLFALRHRMIDEMQASNLFPEWKRKEFVPADDPLSRDIERLFAQYREEGAAILTPPQASTHHADGIIWGIENLDDLNQYRWCCPTSDVFPTQRMLFEGRRCNAPARSDKFLSEVYGDIYTLPSDLISHCPHVSDETLGDRETLASIKERLGPTDS